ncbi:hypothetical protein TYRP_000728 [Tyrophagus putrescentiae]|nr:hypothetical protein TYRP_000728 [Tyrophagus putrescentiae]
MAPMEVHLKSGRAARIATQTSLVKGQQRDLKRRASKLFMEITQFTKDKGENAQLPETLRQEFFKQWERLEFLRENLEVLKSEWENYKVQAEFPVITKRLTTFQTAEQTISDFMTAQGIKKNSYPTTLRPLGSQAASSANEETDELEGEEEKRSRAPTGKTNLQHLFGVKTPAGVTNRKKRQFATIEFSSDEEDDDHSRRMSHSKQFAKEIPSFSGEYLDFPEFLDMFCMTVHYTTLEDLFKLNYLRMKLDERTRRMIRSYRGKDYEAALRAVIDEYTSIASVVAHVRKRAQDLPQVRDPDDLDTLTEVVGQLRSITSLFEHYELNTGLEMEIFREFVPKVPRSYNDRYMRRLKYNTPSLEMYLAYLDEGIATARTRALPEKSSSSTHQTTGTDHRDFDTQRDCTYARHIARPKRDHDWAEEEDDNHHRPPQRRVERSYDSPLADRACLQVNRQVRDDRRQTREKQSEPFQSSLSAERRGTRPGAIANHAPEPTEEDQKDVRFPCKTCGHPNHSRFYCPRVSPQEKRKIAKVLSLCFVCFSKQHTTDDCSVQYECAKCGGRHSIHLCPDRDARLPAIPAQANMVREEPKRSAAELDTNWSPARHNDSLRDFYDNDWGFDKQPEGHIMRVTEEPPQRSTSRLLGPWRNARPE